MEVGVELELQLELELEPGLRTAAPLDVGPAIHKSNIKPVHNSSVHKLVHNSFMTAASGLRTPNCECNMSANNSKRTGYHQGEGCLLILPQQLPQLGGIHGWANCKKAGSQRGLGWRVLGGWCLEVKQRCTPRCVGCYSATTVGQGRS